MLVCYCIPFLLNGGYECFSSVSWLIYLLKQLRNQRKTEMVSVASTCFGALWCLRGPSLYWNLRFMWMSVVGATTEGHADVWGPCYGRGQVDFHSLCYCKMSYSVCGLGCGQKLYWCEWLVKSLGAMLMSVAQLLRRNMSRSVLQLGAVLMSMADITTEGHADVYDLCCCLQPCWCTVQRQCSC